MKALAIMLVLVAFPSVAAGQSDATLLLRTAASECGLDCDAPEIAALNAVIEATSEREGISYRAAWRLLSPRLAEHSVSRAWTSYLDEGCDEPHAWPRVVVERDGTVRSHPPWSHYVERCEVLVVLVRWVLDGAIAAPCVARSWGSTLDAARHFPGCTWVDAVGCADLRNRYGAWVCERE